MGRSRGRSIAGLGSTNMYQHSWPEYGVPISNNVFLIQVSIITSVLSTQVLSEVVLILNGNIRYLYWTHDILSTE